MPTKNKPAPVLQKCYGEAHSNPYIDFCMRCAPHWGVVATCARCDANGRQGTKLSETTANKMRLFPVCPECKTRHLRPTASALDTISESEVGE